MPFVDFLSTILTEEFAKRFPFACKGLPFAGKVFRDDSLPCVIFCHIAVLRVLKLCDERIQRIVARFRVQQFDERVAVLHDKRIAVLFAILFVKR